MPQAASERGGGRTEPEEAVPATRCGGREEYIMDYYMAEIELVEWHRKTRERSARASMLARARQEETEAEMLRHSQALAPERAQCRCWHCAATSRTA